jgi:hypothetical protein
MVDDVFPVGNGPLTSRAKNLLNPKGVVLIGSIWAATTAMVLRSWNLKIVETNWCLALMRYRQGDGGMLGRANHCGMSPRPASRHSDSASAVAPAGFRAPKVAQTVSAARVSVALTNRNCDLDAAAYINCLYSLNKRTMTVTAKDRALQWLVINGTSLTEAEFTRPSFGSDLNESETIKCSWSQG